MGIFPAKKYGVQTAETIWQAKKKCPGLVLLPPHHSLYQEYSRKVNQIYDQYTDGRGQTNERQFSREMTVVASGFL